jgi:uncharacterized protein with ParB-like and HNH nuclease domain
MEEKVLELEPIVELLKKNFFIPDYQRGYRWMPQQVKDLLNDITNFTPNQIENSTEKTWYCLQPVVIKKCDEINKNEHNLDATKTWYEVIDGQQRLTTIYLIGHYINEMWRGRDKDPEIQLKYKTRDESSTFLANLKVNLVDDVDIDFSNIDFFHISTAYKTIHNWVKNKENAKFVKDNFIDKFINNTKVIWYESTEKDTIKIFTRINSGKIPLTNAELIKALFLNSSNFTETDVNLKQLQIATEWDIIEYEMQDESFWYFINEKEKNLDTRIEFIFNLMAGKTNDSEDEFFTFDHFSNKFTTNSKEEITDNWDEIKRYYQTLDEWFTDRELYHKIGFLIATGEDIGTIKTLSRDSAKKVFKEKLQTLIQQKVNVQISKLEYGKPEVKRVLLLHNIQTMLDNETEDSRFPFERYKKHKWDIEHINSVAEGMPDTEKHQEDWLKETSEFLDKNEQLKERASHYNKADFETLFKDIVAYFYEEKHVDDTDDISNLVLLDSKTNRGYKNAVYPVKRKTIISNDKSGTFIPICTKNVFMKFYSPRLKQMTFWGVTERGDYLADIKRVLTNSNYLPIQND